MGIVLSFDEPISSLIAIATPRLDRKGLILVVFVACLLVGFSDEALDGFGGGQRPDDQGFEESELSLMPVSILTSGFWESADLPARLVSCW